MKKILIKTLTVLTLIGTHFSCRERDKIETGGATISDVATSEVEVFTAKLSASITKSGTNPISEHGFSFSKTAENPQPDSTSIKIGAIDPSTPTPIAFTGSLSGLEAKTEYFVRAYAITSSGTSYSKTAKFTTKDIVQPLLQTVGSETITHNSAKLNGSITGKGTHPVSEYGIVWAAEANPTTAVTTKTSVKANVTTFPTNFSANAQNLTANTTYNFRAYVISNGVTSYGANMTFKTAEILQPGVQTGNATDITINSAKLTGTISSKGTHAISERGVVWGTAANPTTANSKASVAGDVNAFPNNFTVNAASLNLNTTYNYRAYVIMNGVTTYGENKTFKTLEQFQPGVQTGNASSIGTTTAKLNGTLSSAGSHAITERGVVWATSANPTTANSKASIAGNVATFPNNFTVDANGLNPSTTYNYRAYVIMNGVTTYGENKTFKTAENFQPPTVTTANATSIVPYSAYLNGNITGGTHPITERGFVRGASSNPTGNKVTVSGTTGQFQTQVTGLTANTNYHYRAYAVSNGVTTYGPNVSFRTPAYVNVALTTSAQRDNVTGGWRVHGTVNTNGSYRITDYGIAYWVPGQSPSQHVPRFLSNTVASNVILFLPASFNKVIPNTAYGTYYYSAYARTSDGKLHYGTNRTFSVYAGPN
jgi:hypothetical protein